MQGRWGGDVDRDTRLAITDAIRVLRHLFAGVPAPCPDAADVDDDGAIRATDALVLLEYVFATGPPPAPPFPDSGGDPTADTLECAGE